MKYSLILFFILLGGCSGSPIFFEKIEPTYYTTKSAKYNYMNDRLNYQDTYIDNRKSNYSTYKIDYEKKIEHDEGPKIYLKVK